MKQKASWNYKGTDNSNANCPLHAWGNKFPNNNEESIFTLYNFNHKITLYKFQIQPSPHTIMYSIPASFLLLV